MTANSLLDRDAIGNAVGRIVLEAARLRRETDELVRITIRVVQQTAERQSALEDTLEQLKTANRRRPGG